MALDVLLEENVDEDVGDLDDFLQVVVDDGVVGVVLEQQVKDFDGDVDVDVLLGLGTLLLQLRLLWV